MWCMIAIAVLVVTSYAAPIKTSVDPITSSTVPAEIADQSASSPEINKIPPKTEQPPITNQPQLVNNDKSPPLPTPILEQKKDEHPQVLVNDDKPEVNHPQPTTEEHHVQEHHLIENPEKPILQSVVPQNKPANVKPQEESEDSDEDDEDDEDSFLQDLQALGLMAINFELGLIEKELDELNNRYNHHGHGNSHGHGHHGHHPGHYTPHKDLVTCSCKNPLSSIAFVP